MSRLFCMQCFREGTDHTSLVRGFCNVFIADKRDIL